MRERGLRMRGKARLACCIAAFFFSVVARPVAAQQEVFHPGETYDSLQAGQDAYVDAEAQRRARIGRQIMIEGYSGYVRQPIGHVKIWTSRLGYIYKPIYGSPPPEGLPVYAASPRPTAAIPPRPPVVGPGLPTSGGPLPTARLNSLPPPPRPMAPAPGVSPLAPGDRPGGNPGQSSPQRTGQDI